jgi:glycosyl transferase family 25
VDIYYINLSARTDRRALMERQFGALGLPARRIEAFTPADLSPEQRQRYCNPARLYCLALTELCCTLSHLAALDLLLASGAPHAAVFEDDVVLAPALPLLLGALDEAPAGSDLIRLETDNRGVRLDPEPAGSIGGFRLRLAYSPTSGTAGYVVTRRGAEAILAAGRVLQVPYDHALFNPYERLAGTLRMRHLDPAVCAQWDRLQPASELSRSDVEAGRSGKGRGGDDHPVVSTIRGVRDVLERELWVGPRQLYRRLRRGAEKVVIPLAGDRQ